MIDRRAAGVPGLLGSLVVVLVSVLLPSGGSAAAPLLLEANTANGEVFEMEFPAHTTLVHEFGVGNSGTTDLTGISATVDGPFEIISPSYCVAPLPPDAGCYFEVEFTASALGVSHGTLTVTAEGGSLETSLPLTGKAVDAIISPNAPVIDDYYWKTIQSIDLAAGTIRADTRYRAHNLGQAAGIGISYAAEQSRPSDGEWTPWFDEHHVRVYPLGPAQHRLRVSGTAGLSEWKVLSSNLVFQDAARTTSAVAAQTWTGAWSTISRSAAYGGSLMSTTQVGAKTRITAKAKRFVLIARRSATSGRVAVYVDGKLQGTYDIGAGGGAMERLVWQRRFPTSKQHTVEVRTLSNPAGHRSVQIDGWILDR